MKKVTLLVGFAAGYVLGAQAGEERYRQIQQLAGRVRARPEVQQAAEAAQHTAEDLATKAKDAVTDKVVDLTQPVVSL